MSGTPAATPSCETRTRRPCSPPFAPISPNAATISEDQRRESATARAAIAAGSTLLKTLAMVSDVRGLVNAPIVIFSYANPILRLGAERFAARAREAGVGWGSIAVALRGTSPPLDH